MRRRGAARCQASLALVEGTVEVVFGCPLVKGARGTASRLAESGKATSCQFSDHYPRYQDEQADAA
jgi:hypothetical protein